MKRFCGAGATWLVVAVSCAAAATASAADFKIVPVATGLNQPTLVTQSPGDDTDLYIVQRMSAGSNAGGILKYNTATHTGTPFLDLSGNPAIYQYNHNGQSKSITGGILYRGPVQSLKGQYFYADFIDNTIHSFTFDTLFSPSSYNGFNVGSLTDRTAQFQSLVQGGGLLDHITDFAEDNAGNMLIASFTNSNSGIFNPPLGSGAIYEVVPVPEPATVACWIVLATLVPRRRN